MWHEPWEAIANCDDKKSRPGNQPCGLKCLMAETNFSGINSCFDHHINSCFDHRHKHNSIISGKAKLVANCSFGQTVLQRLFCCWLEAICKKDNIWLFLPEWVLQTGVLSFYNVHYHMLLIKYLFSNGWLLAQWGALYLTLPSNPIPTIPQIAPPCYIHSQIVYL